MLAKRGVARAIGLVAAATVVGLVAGACTFAKSQPTPIVIYLTPPPPTASPTATPVPSASPTPMATIAESPPPEPSSTAPPPAAAVPASSCTPTGNNTSFWAQASSSMTWDVYCPILPSGWSVSAGAYDGDSGGTVQMKYKGPSGALLEIDEGAFCASDAVTCSPHDTVLGSTNLGDLSGSLDTLSDGSYAIYVRPGTETGYTLTGSGISREAFVSLAAATAKVAKS